MEESVFSRRREGIYALIKCTSAIRQLAYDVNVSFLDEYMQISERTSRTALDHFFQDVMDIYGLEYLRKPTVTDIEKLYRHHEESTGFWGCWEGLIVRIGSGLVVHTPLKGNMLDVIMVRIPIYPELAPLVKTILEPSDDDHKRILYKQKQGCKNRESLAGRSTTLKDSMDDDDDDDDDDLGT
uniref:Uncharacterized protein n=1 Tax=Tanacetum cinerariifolium TaxID=118510 RepID=A0A6L2NBU1_TANCI|nr:hypothetical protein [Tanacetum cinerariifolium]